MERISVDEHVGVIRRRFEVGAKEVRRGSMPPVRGASGRTHAGSHAPSTPDNNPLEHRDAPG